MRRKIQVSSIAIDCGGLTLLALMCEEKDSSIGVHLLLTFIFTLIEPHKGSFFLREINMDFNEKIKIFIRKGR